MMPTSEKSISPSKPSTRSRNSFRPSRVNTTGRVETINFHLSTQPPLGSCDHSQDHWPRCFSMQPQTTRVDSPMRRTQ